MGKSELLKGVNKIIKVSENSINEYIDKTQLLDAKLNVAMMGRKDIVELIGGKRNITTMKDIHNNHLRFIGSILQTPDAETLVDISLWTFRAYMSRGFSSNYFAAQINTLIQILRENISGKAFSEIISTYNWISINIPSFVIAAEGNIERAKNMEKYTV